MAKYKLQDGSVIFVGNPDLNPQLIQGATLVPDTTPLGTTSITAPSAPTTPPVTPTAPVPTDPIAPTTPPPVAPAAPTTTPTAPVSTYSGPSLVDYLSSVNKPADFSSRSRIAANLGITNYRGTAAQNTQILTSLRGAQDPTAPAPTATPTAPTTPPPTAPTPTLADEVKDILAQYGVTPPDPTKNPLTSFADIYKQIYASLGIPDIKAKFEETQKKFDDLQSELNDKIQDVNDNPFLSEPERVGRVNSLQKKYETKLNTLTNQMKIYEGIFTDAKSEAQFVAGKAIDVSQQNQNLVLKAIEQAEKAADAKKKLYAPGVVGEYQFYVEQEKAAGREPLSFNEYQNLDANRKAKIAGAAALTPGQTQTTINQIISQFDNEPVVKNYNVVAEGYQFAQSLLKKKDPTATDDQGLIYAFAKAMDPNSVVREGEYATVQKYAQSWAQAFGFKAQRIFSNTKFLSNEARQNMVNTIALKFQASQQNYQNVENEYNRRIEDAKTGQVTGSLTKFGQAFQQPATLPTVENRPPISDIKF